MKKIYVISCIVIIAAVFSSCKKWLEVQPEDRFSEEQIFVNQQGFEDVLNGIYIQLGTDSLYGKNLTLSRLDVLAQRYAPSSTGVYKEFLNYNYTSPDVIRCFDGIWSESYLTIANVNQLLNNLDRYKQNIPENRATIMKGEALGLRAFVHFDLLRMFGPIYNSADSTKSAIPYYTNLSPEIKKIEGANIIIGKILKDINEAENLLQNDPVKTAGGPKNLNSYRFNLYAVKALKARVLLWRNDKMGALKAAKSVIDNVALFPWIVPANIIADPSSPDRIFSTEVLFGTFSKNLYNNYSNLFYYELSSGNILSVGSTTFLNQIYENNSNDYRNSYIWKIPPQGVSYPTSFKYADVTIKDKPYRFTIPLMRISEMYYIASECEPDPNTALSYLNVVRNNRGVASLLSTTSLTNEIKKEYLKEFYGEGQLWYYYKRTATTNLISPNSTTGVSIPLSAYIFPLPLSELSYR